MNSLKFAGVLIASVAMAQVAVAQDKPKAETKNEKVVVEGKAVTPPPAAAPPDSTTDHSIVAGGQTIAYQAIAGTITVGNNDAFDAMLGLDGKILADSGMNPPDAAKPEEAPATARMFYTAYFKKVRRLKGVR